MKKQGVSILVILTLVFTAFTLGFFLGRNHKSEPVTLSVPASMQTLPSETEAVETEPPSTKPAIQFPIDILRAGKEEFMALPGIGEVLAQRILDYREEIGGFVCIEDLLKVKGIGKQRFEDICDLITIGG